MPAAVTPTPDVILYARPGCGLCDETRTVLRALRDERRDLRVSVPRLVERDISEDPDLERRFFDRIPVVEIGHRRLELAVGPAKLRRLLREALDVASPGVR